MFANTSYTVVENLKCSLDFAGTDTAGTNANASRGSTYDRMHGLQIGRNHFFISISSFGDQIPCCNAFAANFTYSCHGSTSFGVAKC